MIVSKLHRPLLKRQSERHARVVELRKASARGVADGRAEGIKEGIRRRDAEYTRVIQPDPRVRYVCVHERPKHDRWFVLVPPLPRGSMPEPGLYEGPRPHDFVVEQVEFRAIDMLFEHPATGRRLLWWNWEPANWEHTR